MAPPFDRIVHIHVHELEDHSETAGRFVANFKR
jgi:hypothetical protein